MCSQVSDVDFSTKIGGTTFFSSSLKRRQGLPGAPAAAGGVDVPTTAQLVEMRRGESSNPVVTTSVVDIPNCHVALPCLASFPHDSSPPPLEGHPLPARAPRPRPDATLSAPEPGTSIQLQPSCLLSHKDAALLSGPSQERLADKLKNLRVKRHREIMDSRLQAAATRQELQAQQQAELELNARRRQWQQKRGMKQMEMRQDAQGFSSQVAHMTSAMHQFQMSYLEDLTQQQKQAFVQDVRSQRAQAAQSLANDRALARKDMRAAALDAEARVAAARQRERRKQQEHIHFIREQIGQRRAVHDIFASQGGNNGGFLSSDQKSPLVLNVVNGVA